MTVIVTAVPSATLTVTAAASTGGNGSTSTVPITYAVTGWVSGAAKTFAYCTNDKDAWAIAKLLQAAEDAKLAL